MNMNDVCEITEQRCLVTEEAQSERPADSAASRVNGRGLLVAALGWTCLGTGLFFLLFSLLAPDQSLEGTLTAASVSGGAGCLVSSLWLRKQPGFRLFLLAVMTAYCLRIIAGVALYEDMLDRNYFSGQGKYKNSNWEFIWTYENVITAANSVLNKGEWRTGKIYPTKEDKNAYIHTWMGYFMAAGESRHALDLSPFNAYHHMVAALLTAGLALACGFRGKVALWSGALVAWIPWAFPASLMWRDSVGFAWVVLAIVLICLGRGFGIVGIMLSAIPAAFLAWADRSPYIIAVVAITSLSVLYDQQKNLSNQAMKVVRFSVMVVLLGCALFALRGGIVSSAMERHEDHLSKLPFRLAILPLQLLRALAGPFPWQNLDSTYVLFDYAFHVVQFAVFMIVVMRWRQIMKNVNILTYSAASFWFCALISGGVHTAYLAVAFPFIMPAVLDTGASFGRYLLVSIMCFAVANIAYVSVGLVGSGLVLKVTGY